MTFTMFARAIFSSRRYEPPFRGPETQKPFGRVKRTYPAYSLEDINYPMEATEE